MCKRENSKKRVIKKASVVLEKTYIIINRMLVEIWMLKVILVKSQLEMMNMLLETKRKKITCNTVVRTLAQLFFVVLWKAERLRDESGYLAEEDSKRSVEGIGWFLFTVYSKM